MILLIKKFMLNNYKRNKINCSTLRTVTNVLVTKYQHLKCLSLRTVTHVLVNNPKEGYAVFGDIMLKQMRTVK